MPVDRPLSTNPAIVSQTTNTNSPLSVPRMLHHIFEADHQLLRSRDQVRTNITCMQPALEGAASFGQALGYIMDDISHQDLKLKEGRKCEGGTCCEACSRNVFPTFASGPECSLATFPELASFTFNELEKTSAATILQFVRLIEVSNFASWVCVGVFFQSHLPPALQLTTSSSWPPARPPHDGIRVRSRSRHPPPSPNLFPQVRRRHHTAGGGRGGGRLRDPPHRRGDARIVPLLLRPLPQHAERGGEDCSFPKNPSKHLCLTSPTRRLVRGLRGVTLYSTTL